MILHMGGAYGDKMATIDRFRENYLKLPEGVKKRLVLENDDVIYSVHDLLPLCQELNIPLVLDYHHNNIVHSDAIREGTLDIMSLYPAIAETWRRKGITQKMHYSEPTPQAITARQRRKHNPRVEMLPPCNPDMDLMIEAKDKEQAVFELMRKFKLPGWEGIGDIVPHVRDDENKAIPIKRKKKTGKKKEGDDEDDIEREDEALPTIIPDEEIGMGGPGRRVYWPTDHEEWLRPVKRVVKKKPVLDENGEEVEPIKGDKPPKSKAELKAAKAAKAANSQVGSAVSASKVDGKSTTKKVTKAKKVKRESTPLTFDVESGVVSEAEDPKVKKIRPTRRASGRTKKVPYAEVDESDGFT
jgi:UV DNA damage endonuclease